MTMPSKKQLANLRPRKPQRGVAKEARISVRVTEQDKARFMAALDAAGYTVAQLIEAIADGKIELGGTIEVATQRREAMKEVKICKKP